MTEKKPRFCVHCQKPIETGFSCNECKLENRRKVTRKGQHAFYLRRKQAFKNLQEENAKLKQIIEELKHAN